MKTRKVPMRRCVGCMNSKPKKELMRIVYTPEGELMHDLTGKLNGRGIYLCRNQLCIDMAKKKKAISRGLQREIDEETVNSLLEGLNIDEKREDI